jgi:NAD(P)-dependent dehydrogenase (short-subunit alcohol dehydrogenase family)
MRGRSVLVTGATSGIGAATARRFADLGAHVLAAGRNAERLATLAETLPGVSAVAVDLSQPGEADRLAHEVLKQGDLDTLVNCAGFGTVQSSKRLSEAEIDRHFAVNVRASLLLAVRIGEAMKARGRGSIINLSSVQALVGTPHQVAYAATKGAVISMTRALARELGPHSVRVNAVAPGLVATEMWGSALDDAQFMESAARHSALRRWATPEMIADVVVFLASDASAYITGEVIVADGGFVHTGNLVAETAFGRRD